MSKALKAFVALDGDLDYAAIEAVVPSGPQLTVLDYVQLQRHEPGNDGAGDVLIVACADYTSAVSEYVSAASRKHPDRPVVLLCSAPTNGYVAEAFSAGADTDPELATGLARQVLFTLEKAVARKRGAPTATNRQLARVVCVLGLKGGSGKTLTATNLAVALADAGQRVVIVDLDLQFGDIGLALGLSPERTLYDLIRSGGSLDAEKLEDFLVEHPSGARALLAPARPDEAGVVTVDFLREVYQLLREISDFVVIDTPPSFTPEVISAVDGSTEICLVAMLDSLSLKNTKLGLETLELMEYDPSRIRLVLNRADTDVGITPEDVLAITGRQPDMLVPSDRSVTRSINQGEPIVLKQRRSEAAKAFHALAALCVDDARAANGTAPAHSKPRRRRLFQRARQGA
jgi:pilus assembly protein CpaE